MEALQNIDGEQVNKVILAVDAIVEGWADFEEVMYLVNASVEYEAQFVPQLLIDAVAGKFQSERDFANGGADQFVWNSGSEVARRVGKDWCAVGAVENGELLLRLAEELDEILGESDGQLTDKDSVQLFQAYRKRVGGPFFNLPEPDEELAEALLEWAFEHADEICRPELLEALHNSAARARAAPGDQG